MCGGWDGCVCVYVMCANVRVCGGGGGSDEVLKGRRFHTNDIMFPAINVNKKSDQTRAKCESRE